MAVATMELSPDEREHWSAKRRKPGTGLAQQIEITWDALRSVQRDIAPRKVSSVLGTVIPVEPVPVASGSAHVNAAEYFGFPKKFNVGEIQSIFGAEMRTHDSDGAPLSVYSGSTRVGMLADLAIERYGEQHREPIQTAARMAIQKYNEGF